MSAHTPIRDARLLEAATSLANARARRQPGPRVSETFALGSLGEAYQVQAAGMQHALAQGRRLSGAKAGLTSAGLRAALKVEESLYGWLFADTACRSGEVIDWQRLLQPKVEIELALLLSAICPLARSAGSSCWPASREWCRRWKSTIRPSAVGS